jgi:hypothetical protein
MWTVWIGYVLTLYTIGIAYWRLVGGWSAEALAGQELNSYPTIAAVTGMAFFVLGCSYWGWCYAFGLAFHILALLMTLDLRWAPLEFGMLWAVALVIIGIRLHRLGAAEQTPGKKTDVRASREPPRGEATVTVSNALPAAEGGTGSRSGL